MTASYLYSASRTPFGRHGGALAGIRPDDLAATVLENLLGDLPELDPGRIDEVVFGNANGAGEENRNVARMASLLAGIPVSVPGSTVNRLCGSSLDAVMTASRMVETGDADVVVAGGVESMSRAPWVLPKPTRGYPTGDVTAVSTTLGWRLTNPQMPVPWTASLGACNEQLAARFGVDRTRQDEFAVRSHLLADQAWEKGCYDEWVVAVPGTTLERDEGIRPEATVQSLARLRPAFEETGTITAGNASPLSDGAGAILIGSATAAAVVQRQPLARIAGRGAFALDPQDFGIAPVEAANRALHRAGITWAQVGAVELNEAFAVQSLLCVDRWGIDLEIVNGWGGAIAIGHPLGASGCRILGTLAQRLVADGLRWGVAAICIGVGQALAVVIENVSEGGKS